MLRLLLVLLLVTAAIAQRRVEPENVSERLLCVVPMIGEGTPADPKRPLYAPGTPTPDAKPETLLSFWQQVSDDGSYAIVEFVARDKAAFAEIVKDARVTVIERHGRSQQDIEHELRRYKQDFKFPNGRSGNENR